jgi:hypothetical protein
MENVSSNIEKSNHWEYSWRTRDEVKINGVQSMKFYFLLALNEGLKKRRKKNSFKVHAESAIHRR